MPTPTVYPQFKLNQNNGNAIDLDTNSLRLIVLTSAHTFNTAHDFVADVIANEVSGAGYTAGGIALAGVTLALDGSVAEFSHNDVVIAQNAGGFTNGRHAVWAQDTGSDATSRIIMSMDNGADFGNVSGPVTFDVDPATGVLQFT